MPTFVQLFLIWAVAATIAGLSLGLLFRGVAKNVATPVREIAPSAGKPRLKRSA